jgi:hypothetical protein
MRISLSVLLVASTFIGACGLIGSSPLNPTNWFGRSTSEAVTDTGPVNPLIPGTRRGLFARDDAADAYIGNPFDEITDLTIEPVAGGALIRATGRAARQGIYAVQLTPANEEAMPVDGVLTYRLEGIRPDANTAQGAPATREVTAALKITNQDLRGVSTIRVEGLNNAQVARR